jgi:hypothetical protein
LQKNNAKLQVLLADNYTEYINTIANNQDILSEALGDNTSFSDLSLASLENLKK